MKWQYVIAWAVLMTLALVGRVAPHDPVSGLDAMILLWTGVAAWLFLRIFGRA